MKKWSVSAIYMQRTVLCVCASFHSGPSLPLFGFRTHILLVLTLSLSLKHHVRFHCWVFVTLFFNTFLTTWNYKSFHFTVTREIPKSAWSFSPSRQIGMNKTLFSLFYGFPHRRMCNWKYWSNVKICEIIRFRWNQELAQFPLIISLQLKLSTGFGGKKAWKK